MAAAAPVQTYLAVGDCPLAILQKSRYVVVKVWRSSIRSRGAFFGAAGKTPELAALAQAL